MKLKLDENLGSRGAEQFRQAGHDVSTVNTNLNDKSGANRDTEISGMGSNLEIR